MRTQPIDPTGKHLPRSKEVYERLTALPAGTGGAERKRLVAAGDQEGLGMLMLPI